jgi:NAD(P)-dependent dehydrogenase (short-subunit alcohol dehydrogenase family)
MTGLGVVVITGASAGVGRACARAFAEAGFDVGLLARGQAGLDGAARDVTDAGRRASVQRVDVADDQALESAAAAVESELGPIDVWVNNAMESVFAPVAEMRADEYRRVTDVTYLGVVFGTQAALRRMRSRDRGVIVQVGSALAYRSIPLQSAYCAAKHAIVGFTDSLRTELIHDRAGVVVTAVHLPAVNTPQFGWVRSRLPRRGRPVPPIFQPEVAARAIVAAAVAGLDGRPRREWLVGRSTYMAVWGQKFIPGWLDRYLARTAYEGQQTDEPERPRRRDNLRSPLDAKRDHGAHGSFDAMASATSPALQLTIHRRAVAAGAVLGLSLLGAGLALVARRR